MIRITRQIAVAVAFLGPLLVPASSQAPAFDYARLQDEAA
jgi:hypothetical protein